MNYTVIVPFYNEEENVSRFNSELIKNLEKSNTNNRVFEIIYVDALFYEESQAQHSQNVEATANERKKYTSVCGVTTRARSLQIQAPALYYTNQVRKPHNLRTSRERDRRVLLYIRQSSPICSIFTRHSSCEKGRQ